MILLQPSATMIISGATCSGKSMWIARLLRERNEIFLVPPKKCLFCYSVYQPLYDEMSSELGSFITFFSGLPNEEDISSFTDGSECSVLVLDDMLASAYDSSVLSDLFTKSAHHRKIFTINVTQNLLPKGRYARTINLNCHYVCLLKNPRDCLQISHLARQTGLNNTMVQAYNDATSAKWGYLLVQLHPATDSDQRLVTHIFSGEDTVCYLAR